MPRASARRDQHADLQRRDRDRDDEVAEHEERAPIGAASSSRWAPLSRSTITPRPANIVFSGISSPIVPWRRTPRRRPLVCSACMRAGAITSANRTGVSSGTTSSRGVRTLSWKRRATSVASGANGLRATRGRGSAALGAESGHVSGSFRSVRRRRRSVRRSAGGRRRRASGVRVVIASRRGGPRRAIAAIASAAPRGAAGTVIVAPTGKASGPATPSARSGPARLPGRCRPGPRRARRRARRRRAAGVSSATIRPAWMIATRSHSRSASSR